MTAMPKLLPKAYVEVQSDTVADIEIQFHGKWDFYQVTHNTTLDDEEYIEDCFDENGHFTVGYISKEANTKIISVQTCEDGETMFDCVLADEIKALIVEAIQNQVEQDYLDGIGD